MIFLHLSRCGWRMALAPEGKKQKAIAISGEGYPSQKDCKEAIELVREAAGAPVIEVEK